MHGVGLETAERVFAEAGFAAPLVVKEQAEPDPDFPTVAFPNPEEPGALDLAFALAAQHDADLVLANDPDADRVAVGVPDRRAPGGWRRLSGNEIGWLLGWRAARTHDSGTLACSLVSSPALREVARASGLDFVETLTGFKWISRVPGLVYGYEEALGYLVDPEKVRDKDGISAAVAVLSLFSELRAAGETLESHLDHFAVEFGAFASAQISIRVADLADIPKAMTRLRATPPTEIGGLAVEGLDDFLTGSRRVPAHRHPAPPHRRRRARDRAAERHRAETQVLPGCLVPRRDGGRTASRRRRGRRDPRGRDARAARTRWLSSRVAACRNPRR